MSIGRVPGNFSLLVFANIFSQGCLFFASLYLARILGPESFGRVSFSANIAAFFVLFTDCGLTLYGIRELSFKSDRIRVIVNEIIHERIILAVLSFSILSVITLLINKSETIKILILMYGFGVFPAAVLLEWAFQGLEQFRIVAFDRIVTGISYLLLVVIFVQSPADETYSPLTWVTTGSLVALALGYVFYRKHGWPSGSRRHRNILYLTQKTFPMGLSLIMIQLVYTIDSVMLGFLGRDADVGVYAAVYKIILALILVGAVYFETIFPLMSRLCMSSPQAFCDLQHLNSKLVSAFIAPLFFLGLISGELFINILFGGAYVTGFPAYIILLGSVVLVYYNMLYARGLWAFNKQNVFLIIVTIQSVFNILLNFILIPKYGISGAAISTLVAEALGLFFYFRCLKNLASIEIKIANVVPFVLVLVMYAIYHIVAKFIVLVPLLILYALVLYLLKYISRKEILVYEY